MPGGYTRSLPSTTAHSKVGTLTFASNAPRIYTADEVHFLPMAAEQIALAFDNALHFDAAQSSQQQLLKKNDRLGLLPFPHRRYGRCRSGIRSGSKD